MLTAVLFPSTGPTCIYCSSYTSRKRWIYVVFVLGVFFPTVFTLVNRVTSALNGTSKFYLCFFATSVCLFLIFVNRKPSA